MSYVHMLSLQSNGSCVLTQDRVQFIADNYFFVAVNREAHLQSFHDSLSEERYDCLILSQ